MIAEKSQEEPVVERRSHRRQPLYRPELDAIRFIAFFLVFVHHNMNGEESHYVGSRFGAVAMTIARLTGFGLSLFFVLSAFLISDLLIREKDEFGSIDLASFYKRRMLRIWPLYVLGLVIGWLASYQSGHPETARFLAFFLIMGNWYTIKYGWIDNPATPLWSISIEEQFYLFWPTVASRCSKKGMAWVCGGLILLANALLLYFGIAKAGPDGAIWCNTFVEFEMFAAGILLALALKQKIPAFSVPARLSILAGGIGAWVLSAAFCKPVNRAEPISPAHLMVGYALIAGGCCLVLLSFLGVRTRTIPKWLAYLGRISFGLYVFHELAINLTDAALSRFDSGLAHLISKLLGFGLTVLFAAISYRFYETPFLRLKGRLERIKTRAI